LIFQGRDPSNNSGWGKTRAYGVDIHKLINGDGAVMPVPSSGKSISYPVIAPGGGNRVYICWTETEDSGQRAVALMRSRSS
jgi:hypothetical protein